MSNPRVNLWSSQRRVAPVAKLVPAEELSDDFLGKLSSKMKIVGDITQPIEDPDAWEAMR